MVAVFFLYVFKRSGDRSEHGEGLCVETKQNKVKTK